MQFTINENSLFAVLLRSRWWVSFAIAIAVSGLGLSLLPAAYAVAGLIMGAPFAVIGSIAAWRQWQAPSNARIERTVAAVRSMPWSDFARTLQDAYRRAGYDVQPIAGSGADFEIVKEGRRGLVSGKRWKVARTGIEPLRELVAAREATDAPDCFYVAIGEITDNARAFAAKQGIKLVGGSELARLLPPVKRGSKAG